MPTGEDREARKCMIMKQNVIVWMVLSLFLLGCSEDDKVVYETENALLNQNNITDDYYRGILVVVCNWRDDYP